MQRSISTWTFIVVLLIMSLWGDRIEAKFAYVLGDEEHPWEIARHGLGELRGADVITQPGWLAPQRLDGEDLVVIAAREGATFCETWVMYERMVAKCYPVEKRGTRVYGERSWALDWFEGVKLYPLRTQMVYLDLGKQFGVSRIQIEPIPEEALERYYLEGLKQTIFEYIARHPLQWMEVGVNDGEAGKTDIHGRPVLEPVWRGKVGIEFRADVSFPARPVRYVGIQTLGRWPPFHIGAMHVYGEGFIPKTVYRSPIISLGGMSALGDIRWIGRRHPNAKIRIYTRTGMDDDPNLYWRMTEEGKLSLLDARGEPLTWITYVTLLEWEQGGITHDGDQENWSSWSGAYPFEEGMQGIQIVSPTPCRYVQIKVEMEGRYDEERRLDHIAFEYSQPPLANKILGEIRPTQVRPSERTTFHYAIAPMMELGLRGFDTVEIFTPSPVDTVRSVRRDGVEIPIQVQVLEDPPRLMVHFPRVKRTFERVDVLFDAVVFRYGTTFRARAWDWTADEVPQWVTPGDASPDIESSTLSVQTSLKDPLLTSVMVHPNPFSPNGDGFNDETWITYDVLQLTGGAPVRVEILNLSGSLIRMVYAGADPSGRYQRRWDGRDERGALVPPGVYLIRISVQADAEMESLGRTVSVVY